MAGKNDILATAGVDLSAFEAGIAKLTSRLDAMEKAGSKAAGGIDKVAKSTNSLKNIQVAQAYSNAIMEVATSAGVATSAVSNLSKSVGIGEDFPLLKGFAAVSDIASNIPGQIGLIASGISLLIDTAARGIVVEKKYQELAQKGSYTTQSALEKEIALEKAKIDESNTLFANLHHKFGYETQQERQISAQRRNNAADLEKQSKKEIELIKDKTAGAEARIALAEIEKKKNQEIADVNSELQKQFSGGQLDEGALKVRDAITSKIEAEANSKKKILAVSEATEKSETNLANIVAKRDVTLNSQLSIIEATSDAISAQLAEVEKQGLGQTKQAADLRVKLNEQFIAKQNFYYLNGKDLEQQKLITKQIDAQMAGNKKLAALAQIRAQFELQIADAIRQGNAPKAKELAKQQAAAELGARAQDLGKTPQQRAAERKEQAENNRLQRLVNAREKDRHDRRARGAYAQKDSNDFTSKAAEKARKEFAERNAPRILAAGKEAIDRANNFQAKVLNVEELKNAP